MGLESKAMMQIGPLDDTCSWHIKLSLITRSHSQMRDIRHCPQEYTRAPLSFPGSELTRYSITVASRESNNKLLLPASRPD